MGGATQGVYVHGIRRAHGAHTSPQICERGERNYTTLGYINKKAKYYYDDELKDCIRRPRNGPEGGGSGQGGPK